MKAGKAALLAFLCQLSQNEMLRRVLEAELAMQEAQLAKESIEEVARKDAERVASVKAAFVSAAGGTLGSLPYIIGSDGTGAWCTPSSVAMGHRMTSAGHAVLAHLAVDTLHSNCNCGSRNGAKGVRARVRWFAQRAKVTREPPRRRRGSRGGRAECGCRMLPVRRGVALRRED